MRFGRFAVRPVRAVCTVRLESAVRSVPVRAVRAVHAVRGSERFVVSTGSAVRLVRLI